MNHGGEEIVAEQQPSVPADVQQPINLSEAIIMPDNGEAPATDGVLAIAGSKEIIEVEIIPKGYSLIRFPKEKSCFRKIMWFVLWPIHFLFMLTIPDCERPSLKKLFPLTFIMCIVWIGSLSYMVAWMITIIGREGDFRRNLYFLILIPQFHR